MAVIMVIKAFNKEEETIEEFEQDQSTFCMILHGNHSSFPE